MTFLDTITYICFTSSLPRCVPFSPFFILTSPKRFFRITDSTSGWKFGCLTVYEPVYQKSDRIKVLFLVPLQSAPKTARHLLFFVLFLLNVLRCQDTDYVVIIHKMKFWSCFVLITSRAFSLQFAPPPPPPPPLFFYFFFCPVQMFSVVTAVEELPLHCHLSATVNFLERVFLFREATK